MFNPLKMAGDMKGMEKMLKPALEKFMNDSGFVKQAELEELKKRSNRVRKEVREQLNNRYPSYLHRNKVSRYRLRWLIRHTESQ